MTDTSELDLAGDLAIFQELAPVAERNLNRHLSLAKEWMPHEYVPWGRGRDFDELPWEPGQSPLSPVARIAFEVNLLTEDNLPSYHHEIARLLGRDGPWGTWLHRWTAEEGRHSIVMRDYLMVARGVDPDQLERGRMYQVQQGYQKPDTTALGGLAYVSLQELATRISHRNTGHYTNDPVADRLLARVAADENLHMIFYRDAVEAALEVDPSRTVAVICQEVQRFQMPGAGIVDFASKSVQIAKAEIYDLRIHHDEVLQPLLRHWKLFELSGLDEKAEKAREQLTAFMSGLDSLATHYRERTAAARERDRAREAAPAAGR